MIGCSKLWLLAATICVTLNATPGARAWDTAPWDPTPFDQSSQTPTEIGAKLARVEVESLHTKAQGKGATSSLLTSSLITNGQRGCAVNLGNVVLPQSTLSSANISTNVLIKGDVITECH
jgi:hypothetical protein